MRIILAVLCILHGSMTFVGYFLIIEPQDSARTLDIILSFTFAALYIAGGISALFAKAIAIPILALSCLVYAVAGLYHPIRVFGLSSVFDINPQFYFSLLFRCSVAALLFAILRRQNNSYVQSST